VSAFNDAVEAMARLSDDVGGAPESGESVIDVITQTTEVLGLSFEDEMEFYEVVRRGLGAFIDAAHQTRDRSRWVR